LGKGQQPKFRCLLSSFKLNEKKALQAESKKTEAQGFFGYYILARQKVNKD